MFRIVSTAILLAVLCVTMAASAEENDLINQKLREQLAALEIGAQRLEQDGKNDSARAMRQQIENLKQEIAKREMMTNDPKQLREQISVLTNEYVKVVNESTGSLADNARLKELNEKLSVRQAKLVQLESGRPRMGGGIMGDEWMGNAPMGFNAESPGLGDSYIAAEVLDFQVSLLANQLAKSDANTQASIDKALRKLLSELYDSRLQQREDQLKQLEKRVADLRGQLDRQRQAKVELIDLRVKTMINEAKGLGFLQIESSQPSPGSR